VDSLAFEQYTDEFIGFWFLILAVTLNELRESRLDAPEVFEAEYGRIVICG